MCPGSSATLAVEDVFVVDVSVKARVSNHKYIILCISYVTAIMYVSAMFPRASDLLRGNTP